MIVKHIKTIIVITPDQKLEKRPFINSPIAENALESHSNIKQNFIFQKNTLFYLCFKKIKIILINEIYI
ncbi:hypothetical protein EHP00_564 [Ecytonucleospora hepatopenaei]|uniref:Uncharacterized protein n=1 Tax=Ecytonucleospora hepatopenaei TaxID=646526 RepID=A0A1W0E8J6_9MICR|nr:hypothetical protein EHP00_564 [Ecytonucleospora hepatopenaei]